MCSIVRVLVNIFIYDSFANVAIQLQLPLYRSATSPRRLPFSSTTISSSLAGTYRAAFADAVHLFIFTVNPALVNRTSVSLCGSNALKSPPHTYFFKKCNADWGQNWGTICPEP
mmetsp:Transcript_50788/g.61126  ORF Transcript_50788/g.61126 Transcript_50788/m.61126 type:complete len:114 (-) Transcript_50788:145-486(-)